CVRRSALALTWRRTCCNNSLCVLELAVARPGSIAASRGRLEPCRAPSSERQECAVGGLVGRSLTVRVSGTGIAGNEDTSAGKRGGRGGRSRCAGSKKTWPRPNRIGVGRHH